LAGDTANVSAKTPVDPAAGASLYGESFCASCHAVQNAAGNMVGGDVGPELTRVGTKVKPEWLQGWLRNPRVYNPATGMPQYSFTPQQIDALTTALLSLNERSYTLPPSTAVPGRVETDYQPAGKAGKLMADLACLSCHRINGHGSEMAPDLTWEGSSVQRD